MSDRRPKLHLIEGGLSDWRDYLAPKEEGMLTVEQAAERYLAQLHRERGKSAKTLRECFKRLPADFLTLDLASLATADVVAVVRWLRNLRKDDGTQRYADTTIRTTHSTLRAMLNRAVAEGFIASNPALHIPRRVLPPNRPRLAYEARNQVLSVEEASELVSSEKIPFDRRVLYGLALFTGMRIGEVRGARWLQLDPTHAIVDGVPVGRLMVDWQWTHERGFDQPKGAERSIPVHAELAKLLAAWRERCWPGVGSKKLRRAPRQDDLIVPGCSRGRVLCPRNEDRIREKFAEDLLTLRVRRRNFHSCRKSFKSLAVNAGADEAAIESLLHRDGDVYLAWSFERVAKEVARFPVRVELERAFRSGI